MYIEKAHVEEITHLEHSTYLIKVHSPAIASAGKPGQFCNIKVSDTDFPLLRRPFSICDVENDSVHFIFDIHGEGTKLLARKLKGDELDILGPLGTGFRLDGDYEVAIVLAGGIGAAPFPFLIKKLPAGKEVISFIGGRSARQVIKHGMKNIHVSTDDGSEGFKGTVLELFINEKIKFEGRKIRIFACGPNAMLKPLQQLALQMNYDCQISVECAMACGFGICQGCPVEKTEGEGYYLVCKDGPVFDSGAIKL